ncbi:MAG TPA: 2-dehydropantoate 2-reductase [Stellaceae bacterium]|nr:2-dehydropantoate 2-reductase [Stellaceae bacterium]
MTLRAEAAMRILVLGAGAIGGYFGGRLAEAGADVTFLVRPRRQQRLAEEGLVVKSAAGDIKRKVETVLAGGIKSPYDVVLLTCKAYDLPAAVEAITPAMGPKSVVIPMLNGLLHLETLTQRFGRERVMGGGCYIGAMLTPEGHVQQMGDLSVLVFGELDGAPSARARAIAAEFQKGKFTTVLDERIVQTMWEKFVMLTTLASITTLTHSNLGQILAAPEGEHTIFALLAECEAVAKASGYAVRPDAAERTRGLLGTRGSPFTASTQTDMDAGGATEGDHVVGDMVRRGEAKGVATPLLRVALCNLQVYELKRAKRT